jgi:L-alanine-DL-glutamate epimerase-like enolase superfamily enzyme
MKISKVEIIQVPEHQRLLWIHIHTDDGIVGLGETYIHSAPVMSLIESLLAPEFLMGQNPLDIELRWREMYERVNYVGWAGAEIRAISAIDMALWDLGQASGLPIYQLLGGKCRDRLKIYNTCGVEKDFDISKNPIEFARDLLSQGIQVMKIYPFDQVASKTGGQYISLEGLRAGIEPIHKIREALGEKMNVAVEFHGHWNLPSALRITQALEEYNPLWLEDIMKPDNLEAYNQLARATSIPLAISERLFTRYQFAPVVQRGIAGVLNPDLEWCGGITEAKKIASLGEIYHLPIVFHNYGGPLLNFASAHVAASIPNFMLLETGRHRISKWTNQIISNPISIKYGFMNLPKSPGLGTSLSDNLLHRDDLIVTTLAS